MKVCTFVKAAYELLFISFFSDFEKNCNFLICTASIYTEHRFLTKLWDIVLYRELQLALVMTLLKRPTLRGRPLGFGTFCLVLQGRFSARFRKCVPESHKTGHATNLFDSSKVADLPAEKKDPSLGCINPYSANTYARQQKSLIQNPPQKALRK
jgi:hypothetical protein